MSVGSQTHDNRQHQGHRTRITHKSSDSRSNQHNQNKKPCLALTCQLQYLSAYHLRQPGLEYRTTYHEKTDHHNHDRIGESRQRFIGSKNVEKQQQNQSAQGYHIRAYFTTHEKHRR